MQTTFTSSASWRQVQHVFLILQRSVGFQQWNGDGPAPGTIYPLWDWAWVMEMESGEDVRGSLPTLQGTRGAQPYTGGLWQG